MSNRKPQARHAGFRIAVFETLEEAQAMDRSGQLCFQNFDHELSGLDGLEAIDEENNFEDGDIFVGYIRICKNQGKRKVEGRKVTLLNREGNDEATEALPLS
jgi:hypothetical protein